MNLDSLFSFRDQPVQDLNKKMAWKDLTHFTDGDFDFKEMLKQKDNFRFKVVARLSNGLDIENVSNSIELLPTN